MLPNLTGANVIAFVEMLSLCKEPVQKGVTQQLLTTPGINRHPNEATFLPVPLLSLLSTQPTIPVLSEASDRDMNVIFPLVFLTAVLNSYKTLRAPWLLPYGSLSQGYL